MDASASLLPLGRPTGDDEEDEEAKFKSGMTTDDVGNVTEGGTLALGVAALDDSSNPTSESESEEESVNAP